MTGRDLASGVVKAMTPSSGQLVWFFVVFAMPWVIGEAFLLLQAVRFAFRVWGWLA